MDAPRPVDRFLPPFTQPAMTNASFRPRRHPSTLPAGVVAAFLFACAAFWPHPVTATQLIRDAYYWYAPEHEKYIRTEFYREPDFRSPEVKITGTQRFRFDSGRRGWALLQFDGGVQAYIHLRVLRTLLWDPTADDPWYEFRRASVFPEDPERIEARLKPGQPEPPQADSRTPVWKRYKESWDLDHTRPGGKDEAQGSSVPGKRAERRYPLLPPLGSNPDADPADRPGSAR